jgi:23S rRNA U2552 (ribose-2'-O)-methylase RlmE/FtsJ
LRTIVITANATLDVHFIQGDFKQIDKLQGYHRLADVILSDMLMNTCGDSITDHYRSMNTCNDVLTYSDKYLDKNGHILCKFYTGLSLLLCLLNIIHDCTVC